MDDNCWRGSYPTPMCVWPDMRSGVSLRLRAQPAPQIAAVGKRLSAGGCAQQAWENSGREGFEHWYASAEDACVDLQAGPDQTEWQVPGHIVGLQHGE
jgi:hypothetical protein